MSQFLRGAGLLLGAGLLAASGCTSTSSIDTAFSGIAAPPDTPLADPARPDGSTRSPGATSAATTPPPADLVPQIVPRNTGTFPNINAEPAPSPNQLSDAEAAAQIAQMERLAADQAAGRLSAADYQARAAALQRLARDHSADAIRRIEGR